MHAVWILYIFYFKQLENMENFFTLLKEYSIMSNKLMYPFSF